MEFATSLERLLDEGRVLLASSDEPTDVDMTSAEHVLTDFESRYRDEMPGTPPDFLLPAAMWAATLFFEACRCLVYREIDDASVDQMLQTPFEQKRDASAHYSVDLIFRYLPDLFHRVKSASSEDVLLQRLQDWANDWPLSSVGLAADVEINEPPIIANLSLCTTYVDRIIAKKDFARIHNPRVREAVKCSAGLHEELAPDVLAAANQTLEENHDA